jgi:hypothetical protein
MVKYIRPVLTLLLVAPCYCAFAQTASTLNQTLTNLQKHAIDYVYEKVYLHIDKPYYAAGDTIWFKGYTVIGPKHQLSIYSGVLNAELINEHNEIVQSLKLNIKNGVSNAEFALPDTLKEGKYHLRAYTNWMRNAGPAYFYNNNIQIVNPITGTVFTKVNHTYSNQNGKPVTNTSITYTNINGEPYPGREVKYAIMQNKRAVINGTSVTDNNGRINVSFVNPETSPAQAMVTTLQVGNKPVTKEFALTPAINVADVQFFPESGSLVNGLPCKVAFKAINPNGLGADVKGTIVDDQNKEVISFVSSHLGMGTFMLTPQPGRSYRAKVEFKDGKSTVIDLPKAADKGYILSMDNSNEANLAVKILSSNVPQDITLIAQADGVVYFAGKSNPGKSVFAASIPKSKFPTGTIQFTIFSATGEPLNERLVFIKQPDGINLNIATDKNLYIGKDKVKISMTAHDNNGQPLVGNFSTAVINESELPVDETAETTILSHLLLTADLTGYIEKPNYYFINDNEKAKADLDVLMLTQGYHKYEWKKLAKGEMPAIAYKPETGLTVTGRVIGRDKKPAVGAKVSLFSMTASGTIDTVTNASGQFAFDNIGFADSTQLTIKAVTAKNNNNVKIILDKPELPNVLNIDDVVTIGYENNLAYLNSIHKNRNEKANLGLADFRGTLLDEVTVKSLRATALQYSRNLNGPGNANQVIYPDNLMIGCATFQSCLTGRLAGVEFNTTTGNPVSTRSRTSISSTATETSSDMAIVFNGAFIPPGEVQSFLQGINMGTISTVEVLRSGTLTAMYGSRGSNGVLIITSKHGRDINMDVDSPKNMDPDPGFANIIGKGYAKAKVFYSPRYDGPKVPKTDLRSTVYWNPSLQTDKNGTASFEYFNTDRKGNYRVVIEGIDYAGHIGRQVYRYKVN